MLPRREKKKMKMRTERRWGKYPRSRGQKTPNWEKHTALKELTIPQYSWGGGEVEVGNKTGKMSRSQNKREHAEQLRFHGELKRVRW